MSSSPVNGTLHQRHQFRRQGSSYGPGQVHHMAVMLAPQKLDYSVTKGGLKTWIVLIVFFLLCSALFAVFSETDLEDDDISHTTEDTEPAEQLVQEEEVIPEVEPLPPDIDDESEPDEEELLFGKLREKAKAREAKKKHPKQQRQQEEEPRHIQRRKRLEEERRQKAEEEEAQRLKEEPQEESEEAADSSEEEEETTVKPVVRKPIPQEESNEVEDDDDDEDNSEEQESTPPPKRVPIIAKKPVEPEPKSLKDDDDDEDDSQELILPKKLRTPKKAPTGVSWHKSIQAQQILQDTQNPRMSLLKGNTRKFYPKLKAPLVASVEESEEEEESNGIEGDDDESVRIRDLTTVRKRTNFYNRKSITNRQDYKYRGRLDAADFLLEKHEFDDAIKTYEEILSDHKYSPRARYGLGHSYQLKGEFHSSDQLTDQAINEYQQVLDNYETPDELFRLTAENLIECARYRGNLHKVMTVQRELVDRFPEDLELQNDFGITFLMMGRPEDARTIFTTVLEIDPQNPVAQAYFGYILKVYDQEFDRGVQFMRKGLKDREEPIQDPKFYFHLGDGLMRLGRQQDAFRVYEEAVELGLFPSVYQRSTYNLDGLSARPWWTLSQTQCSRHLKAIERQYTAIREEALNAWNEDNDRFVDEDPHITSGTQKALHLRIDHAFNEKNCLLTPTICQLLKEFADESKCDKGNIKISVMQPGARIWPHCGPTNFVLEAQLGLVCPSEARIRVGKEVRGWKMGKFLIFDKSFEHELWFDGATKEATRIILSIDLWHPEVPLSSRVDAVY